MANIERDGFGSRFGVLVAVAGSAVGLGNLWRFPYMVGNNGGAAFIILYLFFVILLCLPIMFSEFVIGRRTQSNAFGAIKKIAPKSGWLSIGVISVVASICIMSFYSVVGGWTLEYIFKSFSPDFLTSDSTSLANQFSGFSQSSFMPVAMHLLFLTLSALIVVAGVKNGIEKYSKILMPILFILVLLLAIRSLTLDGASEGVRFLLYPDFSKITGETMLAALGQAFFSLSLGMGCIITYGSYVNRKENLFKISFMSAFADTGFAILAGLAVMPAVFAFGISPGQGPSLVFITLPQIFAQMPFGGIISIAFFFILLIAAITSAISLLEVVVAYFTEELKMTRKVAVVITFIIIGLFGTFSSLSQGPLKDITIFGKTFFDLFDYASSNVLLPVGGLLVVLFVGWRMKRADVLDELTSGGTVALRKSLFSGIMLVIKFLAPIAISIVLLNSIF
ncbi:MAG: Na+-dependent transporter [Bacteroidetes bacterium GWE2_39_28]|nr:MAG: Na+-dependent transporter [Bacteroidetes bacterium GWE2_39_28]OFY12009.1 MAG: Na+-dependent transporter [Bacteroidetes bacterium GWF2_39_10]OFZ07142.1 MAG: Na+-dependent transporter [Bacteroidetes bacterium RIFOXYB2_FULL_39_7]OFZ11263.1 MAG: Na+-dependent transporter [Bacteroidetes bacterium RIFOXYC2_FULL_39_11]HCT95111.1 sodium-dependent transporter [Rikenellaceae bacterium]